MATIREDIKGLRVSAMNHVNSLRSEIKTVRTTRSAMGSMSFGNLSLGKIKDTVVAKWETTKANVKGKMGGNFVPRGPLPQAVQFKLQPTGPVAQEIRLS